MIIMKLIQFDTPYQPNVIQECNVSKFRMVAVKNV